eukprot:GEMP01065558.1.p1 GENE.GEMP01065558.1~~GEMP01065558.1.p1  ORF type:complete len:215 (+),score=41.62 GEMP01065558.1:111-755(+)
MACILNGFVRPSSASSQRPKSDQKTKSHRSSSSTREERQRKRKQEDKQDDKMRSVPGGRTSNNSGDAATPVAEGPKPKPKPSARILLDIRCSHETSLGVCVTRPAALPDDVTRNVADNRVLDSIERQIRQCEKPTEPVELRKVSPLVLPMAMGQLPDTQAYTSEQRASYWWKQQHALERKKNKLLTRPYDERYKFRQNILQLGDSLRSPRVRTF